MINQAGPFFCIFLVMVSTGVTSAKENTECRQKWDQLLQTLLEGRELEFKTSIAPFANATTSSYTGQLDLVTGWTVIKQRNPVFGLHAIAYQNNEDKTLILVAIRGAQLAGTQEERLSDLCAYWWLTRADDLNSSLCAQLTYDQINYFGQLKNFLNEIDEEFHPNETCKVYSGHSLGATLASLASADSKGDDPAIVFGPSGPYYSAEKLGLPLVFDGVHAFYSQYDPITLLSMDDQVGTFCAMEEAVKPESCDVCYSDPQFDITNLTTPCGSCFMQTHIYGHYLDLLFDEESSRNCTVVYHLSTSAGKTVEFISIFMLGFIWLLHLLLN